MSMLSISPRLRDGDDPSLASHTRLPIITLAPDTATNSLEQLRELSIPSLSHSSSQQLRMNNVPLNKHVTIGPTVPVLAHGPGPPSIYPGPVASHTDPLEPSGVEPLNYGSLNAEPPDAQLRVSFGHSSGFTMVDTPGVMLSDNMMTLPSRLRAVRKERTKAMRIRLRLLDETKRMRTLQKHFIQTAQLVLTNSVAHAPSPAGMDDSEGQDPGTSQKSTFPELVELKKTFSSLTDLGQAYDGLGTTLKMAEWQLLNLEEDLYRLCTGNSDPDESEASKEDAYLRSLKAPLPMSAKHSLSLSEDTLPSLPPLPEFQQATKAEILEQLNFSDGSVSIKASLPEEGASHRSAIQTTCGIDPAEVSAKLSVDHIQRHKTIQILHEARETGSQFEKFTPSEPILSAPPEVQHLRELDFEQIMTSVRLSFAMANTVYRKNVDDFQSSIDMVLEWLLDSVRHSWLGFSRVLAMKGLMDSNIDLRRLKALLFRTWPEDAAYFASAKQLTDILDGIDSTVPIPTQPPDCPRALFNGHSPSHPSRKSSFPDNIDGNRSSSPEAEMEDTHRYVRDSQTHDSALPVSDIRRSRSKSIVIPERRDPPPTHRRPHSSWT